MVTKFITTQLYKSKLSWFLSKPWALISLVFALVILFDGSARSDTDIQSIRNQIEILNQQLSSTRAEMQDLQRSIYSGKDIGENYIKPSVEKDSNAASRLAILETRVDEYDLKMRQTSGRFDELGNRIEQISSRLETLIADVDFRLAGLETAISNNTFSEPEETSENFSDTDTNNVSEDNQSSATIAVDAGQGYVPSNEPTVLGTLSVDENGNQNASVSSGVNQGTLSSPTLQGDADEQYAYAMSFMQNSEWEKAGLALKTFVANNQDHPLAQNAAYWQGESFYARKQFDQAARLYALNFKRYPNGKKAPDNLVKLGLSLVALKRLPEACQTFDKLMQDFPQVRDSVKKAVNRGQSKAGCN